MRYDSLGRMVLNVEPNTSENFTTTTRTCPNDLQAWRYAYNDAGDLVGTSDARGCGENFQYDGAGRLLGRLLAVREPRSRLYGAPNQAQWTTSRFFYHYDTDPDIVRTTRRPTTSRRPLPLPEGQTRCRLRPGSDHRLELRRARPRHRVGAQVAKPGIFQRSLATATRSLVSERLRLTTALIARSPDHRRHAPASCSEVAANTSATTYSQRGTVLKRAGATARSWPARRAPPTGLIEQILYGDAADHDRLLLRRPPPPLDGPNLPRPPGGLDRPADPELRKPALQDLTSSPTTCRQPDRDPRLAQPRRVARRREAGLPTHAVRLALPGQASRLRLRGGGGQLDVAARRRRHRARTRARNMTAAAVLRAPPVAEVRLRLARQHAIERRRPARLLRPLGGHRQQRHRHRGPYQLAAATNESPTPGNKEGALEAQYDAAGNLSSLNVRRRGTCKPYAGQLCSHKYRYEWDEVGRLTRARRWDVATSIDLSDHSIPTTAVKADMRYEYDESDSRRWTFTNDTKAASSRYNLYIYDTLEWRRATLSSGDYLNDSYRVSPQLVIGGQPRPHLLGRERPQLRDRQRREAHLPEPPDHLGSSAAVIDKASGELVERSTYQPSGRTRATTGRCGGRGREDKRFTGKEEDVEVGLVTSGRGFCRRIWMKCGFAGPPHGAWAGRRPEPVRTYVSGRALQSNGYRLGSTTRSPRNRPRSAMKGTRKLEKSNTTVTFGDATIHAKPPRPAVTDVDKIADGLGVPRPEIQQGAPTPDAVDRASMALPTRERTDKTLRPLLGPAGIRAWTTESGGTRRKYSLTGEAVGYAGEKPVEPTMSPIDLVGGPAARGLWSLGGRSLQLGRAGLAQWHFQRTVTRAVSDLTEADAIALTSVRTARAAAGGDPKAYGRVVEAATGDKLGNSWLGRMLYRPSSGNWLAPGRVRGADGRFVSSPDFQGQGAFRGLTFDVTTAAQADAHRATYPGVLLGVY